MTNVKVGLFAIAAIIGIVYMSLRIGSNQARFGNHNTYYTIIEDASGIFVKTPIKVAGINAGRILDIRLENSQARIEFEVLDKIVLTKDSFLRLKSVGFLGDKYLDIYLGTDAGEALPNKSFVRSVSGGGMENLAQDAGEILAEIKDVMTSLKTGLTADDGTNLIKEILQNTRKVTKSLAEVTVKNQKAIGQIIRQLNAVTGSLQRELDGQNADSLLVTFKRIGPILADARAMMEDLRIMVADVKAGRGTVGRLLRDEEVVDKVSQTLTGVNRIVNRINTIQTQVSLFSGVNTQEDNKTDVNVDLYTAPERFYRFGLTSSDFGPSSTEEITTTVNGTSTIETRETRDQDSFTFNAQMGKRFQSWGVRAGIIESTGGLGVDYYLTQNGTRFSVEGFDYDKDLGPNLRFTSDIHLWNVLYARFAAEDMVSKDDNQNYTFAAGLRFTDEDLRGLLGILIR